MLLYYLLYFFVAVGAKLVLAAITIYLLLPTDPSCCQCDERTLLMRPGRLGRLAARAAGGRIQSRWCPRCHWGGLARRPRTTALSAAALDDAARARR